MNQAYMKEKPVFPLLTSMALPMMLSMLVGSLYNIIDSYFVAKISEASMTALSLVFPVQNLINAVSVGFAIGINSAVAFYLGAGKQDSADTAATVGILLSGVHGFLLTAAGLWLMPGFLRLFTADEAILEMGLQYSNIVLLFTLPNVIAISIEKIFQAVGKMTVSMVSMMCGCVTNIILDPFLIFGIGFFPALGIKGAAIATGIGQTTSLAIYLLFYFGRPISVTFCRLPGAVSSALIRRLYAVGVPATLNLALPSLLVSVLNSVLSAYGSAYVLVLGAYYKLQTFLYLSANGIIQGMRPLVGYNFGAGEYRRVRRIHSTGLTMILTIMLLGTALCLAVPSRLIGLFTTNRETIALGVTAIRLISIGFFVSGISVTVSGTLEGLGMGAPSLVISLCRYVLFIIPLAVLFSRNLGANGVWLAFGASEGLTAVVSWGIYRYVGRRRLTRDLAGEC